MFRLEFTNQYLKDLRLVRKRNLDESKLNELILILLSGDELPLKYKDHISYRKYEGAERMSYFTQLAIDLREKYHH